MPKYAQVLGFTNTPTPPDANRKDLPPLRYYKAYVIERVGDCYKIANSDLGRTMTVSSKSLRLHQGNHYQLGLRKVPLGQGEGEAPGGDDCKPEWEVITREDR